MRALDDRRIDIRAANAMNRLLRTCQASLKGGSLHESDSDKKSPSAPLKPAGAGAPRLDSDTWEETSLGEENPDLVQRVILTPSGEELAPPLEIWEQDEPQLHGEACPCRRCAEQYRSAAPEQHHPNCGCGQCPIPPDGSLSSEHIPSENDPAGAPSFRTVSPCERVGEQDSPPLDSSLSREEHVEPFTFHEDDEGAPCLEETWDSRDPYAVPESEEERMRESERRTAIIEKHKHRITKIENQYQYSPQLADRLRDEIQTIMELEMGSEAFSYQPHQLAAS